MDAPVIDQLPVLMNMVEALPQDLDELGGWSLSTLARGPIDLELDPAALGIRDGEVLHLARTAEAAEQPFIDDVLHRIGIASENDFALWRGPVRDRAVSLISGVGLAISAVALAVIASGIGTAAVVAAIGIGAVAAGWALRDRSGAEISWAVVPALASAGALLARNAAPDNTVLWALIGAALGVGIVGLLSLSLPKVAGVIGLTVAVVLAVVAGAIALGASGVAIAAWGLIPLLLILGFGPKLAMMSSGIVALVRKSEEGNQVPRSEMSDALAALQSRTDVVVSTAAILITCVCAYLAVAGVWVQGMLTLVVAVVLVLHSRSYSHARHVVPLLGAAMVAGVAGMVALPGWFGIGGVAGAAMSAVFVTAVLVGIALANVATLDAVAAARLTRGLNAIEYPVVLAIIPLVFLAQGVYQLFWPS